MRSFMHQVAKIEAEYSSALGKATASVLKKKGWPKNPMIPTADNIERKTVTTCWKLVLEETVMALTRSVFRLAIQTLSILFFCVCVCVSCC